MGHSKTPSDSWLYDVYGGPEQVLAENEIVDEYWEVPKTKQEAATDNSGAGESSGDAAFELNLQNALVYLLKTQVFGQTLVYLFNNLHFSNRGIIPVLDERLDEEFGLCNMWHAFGWIVLTEAILHTTLYLLRKLAKGDSGSGGCNGSCSRKIAGRGDKVTILQLSIAIIGVAYCFKKLRWMSTLHADLIFALTAFVFTLFVGSEWEEVLAAAIASVIMFSMTNGIDGGVEAGIWSGCFQFLTNIVFLKLLKTNKIM